MSKAKSIIEAATFETLNVPAVTNLAPVYQHVPQNTEHRVVVIGDIEAEPFGTKGSDPDRKAILTIGYLYTGEERKPLHAIQEQVETLLDGKQVQRDGWTLSFTYLDDGEARDEERAELYGGISRFTVLALKD